MRLSVSPLAETRVGNDTLITLEFEFAKTFSFSVRGVHLTFTFLRKTSVEVATIVIRFPR